MTMKLSIFRMRKSFDRRRCGARVAGGPHRRAGRPVSRKHGQ